jgi:hypothetical protein
MFWLIDFKYITRPPQKRATSDEVALFYLSRMNELHVFFASHRTDRFNQLLLIVNRF